MSVLPVEGIGVLLDERGREGERGFWARGLDESGAAGLAALPTEAGRLWIRADRVRGVTDGDASREGDLAAAGAAVVLAMPRGAGTPQGLLALGPKSSGHRFTNEDVELLQTLSADLALNLGRIRIQEEMIYERASREKSEELVRMKTEFISALSHELRTPMTSLGGLCGLLRSGKVEDPAQRERLLGLMAGECGRLARFLTNVLDYGKIEADAKTYAFRDVDLGPLARDTVDLVRGSSGEEGPAIAVEAPDAPVVIRADPDAVRQALLNLLDNAVKYSPKNDRISVTLTVGAEAAVISVKDRGIGIAPAERERIFEAFYRSPQAVERDPTGVGLGIASESFPLRPDTLGDGILPCRGSTSIMGLGGSFRSNRWNASFFKKMEKGWPSFPFALKKIFTSNSEPGRNSYPEGSREREGRWFDTVMKMRGNKFPGERLIEGGTGAPTRPKRLRNIERGRPVVPSG